ncbi:hypothetical protein GCM10009416_41620 [Craurococcus roseus]|uniref:DUF305 domain-containing protein n=1 Tax=Craurococcus roseus TaxID=77585 RepID=A0ABP3QWY8_9PROT
MTTTRNNNAARRAPPRRFLAATAAAAGLALAATPALASIEENYAAGEPPVTSTWFAPVSDAAQRADRDYVAGMRPHHAGALSMSREYLADPGRSSPLLQALSRAIVANQTFEIGMLDEVGRNLDRPPLRLPFGIRLQPVATEGLTGAQRFFKEPIPSEATYAAGPVSERDVLFAKSMIMHHEGAVEMARGYHANADARNGYLGLMNVDIVTDQTQEIALMRRVVAAYPGDANLVRVDPSMVHGMEGMKHGGHAATAAAPPAAPARAAADGGHAHRHGGGDYAAHGRHGEHHRAHHGGNAAHGGHGGHHSAGAARAAAPEAAAARPQPRPAQRPRPAAAQRTDGGTAAGRGGHQHGGHHGHHH